MGELTPLDFLARFELMTRDEIHGLSFNAFERAFAGGLSLQAPSGARTIDQQRTSRIHLESTEVWGMPVRVAVGVPHKSKAPYRPHAPVPKRVRAQP